MVGYMLNGQHVVRSLPSKVNRAPSELTLINRGRMKATSEFLRPLKHILEFSYQHIAPKGSRVGPFQTAQSHVFKNALDYHEDSTPYVNPSKVLVFRGAISPPEDLQVSRTGNILNFTWKGGHYGVLMILAYLEDAPQYVFFNEQGPKAETGTFSWDIETGRAVHIYAAFYQMIKNEFSDSVYGGKI
jgi:hypothetical protein